MRGNEETMAKTISGKVWKFGHNIDTDIIIPARYLNTSDPAVLARHCMEGEVENFTEKISAGDVILAGENFGCGSSREHAPVCIKAAGVSCVVASSFARIFFRNAVNIGLPVFEVKGIWEGSEQGDALEIAPDEGEIKNITRGSEYRIAAYPEFIRNIIESGGLIPWVRARLGVQAT
jgi:3-isopropylmalate/(R)-2-methylmalate dehydratase small subunit